MNKLFPFMILGMFLLTLVPLVAADNIGTFKVNEPMQLTNYCIEGTCTYMTLGVITTPSPNSERINVSAAMTQNGQNFNYSYTPTKLGIYTFTTCGNPGGNLICDSDTFESTSSGSEGSNFFIILITALAVIFFIASLFVPEEFFVYISGVCFLIGGIYLMSNGLDVLNDTNTRYLAFIYLGIGLLFSLGAYIYNLYEDNTDDEY